MKHASFSLTLALPALFAFAGPADELGYPPAEGLRLTKTFTFEVETSIDDMEIWVNGEETEAPGMENDTALTASITITDHYAKVEEGRPVRVERTFDGISGEMNTAVSNPMIGERDFEVTTESELEGTTVVFEWNDEDEEYEIAFSEDDEEEDEELLADLTFDMDLRAFLPDGEVSEDDSWEVDPEALVSLLSPGGDLKLSSDEDVAGMDMGNQFDLGQQLGLVEGSITATYRGTRNVDGRTVGVVELAVETESSNDITDFLNEASEAAAEQSGANIEQDIESADVQSEYELEGELLWDLEGGHIHSLEIEGDTESVMDLAATVRAMGEEIEAEQAFYMSGTLRVTVEVTRE
jgi:hypothetical protein